jgi:FlaA1/EpsC-like NDP-sugar epimerase
MNYFKGKEILIIGGTGSLGTNLFDYLIKNYEPRGIRIFSRDELKQWELQKKIKTKIPVVYILGDIRDFKAICRAMNRVDIVINAAALKQVGACENNVYEAINTNIIGSRNVVDAAINNKVAYVMHLSTDKAVESINLYGKTKAVADSIFLFGNTLSGSRTKFNICRYGNVLGSRGSVIELFIKQSREKGEITITDKKMTRFWITLDRIVKFICNKIENYNDSSGNIFIPEIYSCRIIDLIQIMKDFGIINKNIRKKVIGIQKGEKLHECLLSNKQINNICILDNFKNIKEMYSDKMIDNKCIIEIKKYLRDKFLKIL